MDRGFIRRVLDGEDGEWPIPKNFTGDEEDIRKIDFYLDHNGDHVTIDICMEELAELIKEISKADRMKNVPERLMPYAREGLEEEIADVMIVIRYLEKIYDLDMDRITKIITLKLDVNRRKILSDIAKSMKSPEQPNQEDNA